MNGSVEGIYISPIAGGKMQEVQEVRAIAGAGLEGDRYATGEGSFNRGNVGRRQVTLINELFFNTSTHFKHADSRRNIITAGVELMWLIGREFRIGEALFAGVKYCDPCTRPSKLANIKESFAATFFDRGGLVAEVLEGGFIRYNDAIIPPPKGY